MKRCGWEWARGKWRAIVCIIVYMKITKTFIYIKPTKSGESYTFVEMGANNTYYIKASFFLDKPKIKAYYELTFNSDELTQYEDNSDERKYFRLNIPESRIDEFNKDIKYVRKIETASLYQVGEWRGEDEQKYGLRIAFLDLTTVILLIGIILLTTKVSSYYAILFAPVIIVCAAYNMWWVRFTPQVMKRGKRGPLVWEFKEYGMRIPKGETYMNTTAQLVIIDIETTGLDPVRGNEITEIGAVLVDTKTLKVIDTFETLVKTQLPVPYFITNLTGITDEMLNKKGIPLEKALASLSNFCGDSTCFAHNASFDKKFIRHYLSTTQTEFIETEWVDTISIFRQAFPGRKTYKLESLILDFELAKKEDHRAISDAMHTLSLLKIARGIK